MVTKQNNSLYLFRSCNNKGYTETQYICEILTELVSKSKINLFHLSLRIPWVDSGVFYFWEWASRDVVARPRSERSQVRFCIPDIALYNG